MVIWRKGAADHRAGRGEVDRELVGDGRVLHIGDAVRRRAATRECGRSGQLRWRRAGRAARPAGRGRDRRCRPGGRGCRRPSGSKGDARAGACAARRRSAGSPPGPRSMIERPPIFTPYTQGRSRIGRPPTTGRVRSGRAGSGGRAAKRRAWQRWRRAWSAPQFAVMMAPTCPPASSIQLILSMELSSCLLCAARCET